MTSGRWFSASPNTTASQWLVCIPHAGSGASAYFPWASRLPRDCGLRIMQYPGREIRYKDPLCRDVRTLVSGALSSVVELSDRPWALFGHSLGALVAIELARAVRNAGLPMPTHLYVSGRVAPHVAIRESDRLWKASDAELVEVLRRLGGTPTEVLDHPNLLALFLPMLRADFEMNSTYHYRDEPPLDIPMMAFGATRDKRGHPADMEAWERYTTGAFEVVALEGGHFALLGSPEVLLDRVAGQAHLR
jgi:medium-chain acyl-[acyl-carrier-protein] hydrolase